MDLLKLKSGSDIRGNAVETPGQPVELTDEIVGRIAGAFAGWLKRRGGGAKIAVGHDSRISADRIGGEVKRALIYAGCTVCDCGLCSTPSMFMMTQYPETQCGGSIMITASHHPFNKNGLKFFTRAGGLESADISELLSLAAVYAPQEKPGGKIVSDNYMRLYSERISDMVRAAAGSDMPLKGFKIAVDAGNGAGGFYSDILMSLGADTSCSQFLQPDGRFPNHVPNPEDAAAMRSISRRVLETGADLGVIFDTDVDRAAIVDASGEEINRNRLIALISAILLAEQPGAAIVTDSVTSDGLRDFIMAKGGKHIRFKRGYKNVINEAVRLNALGVNTPLAIETSGHAAMKENFFLDDGAYLVTRIIIKMALLKKEGRDISDLLYGLKMPQEAAEARIKFTSENWQGLGKQIIGDLTGYSAAHYRTAPDNAEGIRANIDTYDGWFLVRMSVHDPVMPVNIESNVSGGAKAIAKELVNFLSSYSGLDISGLEKLCK